MRYFIIHTPIHKYPYEELEPGFILSLFESKEEENTLIYSCDSGDHTLQEKELIKFAEEISEETFLRKKTEILESHEDIEAFLNYDPLQSLPQETEEPQLTKEESNQIVPTQANTSSKVSNLRNQTLQLKNKAETLKKKIKRHEAILHHHANALKAEVKYQAEVIQKKMETILEKASLMENVLHTANLYLGAGNLIIPICDGERAPKTIPVTIRQRKLYMDEEAMVKFHNEIDCHNLSKFDEYVQYPEFLEQILPEKRGIIAIQVSQNPPKYKGVDPYTQVFLNQENSKTYWLIRNGNALWRFWGDFHVPEKIFPDPNQTQISKKRPGSKEFYNEMKTAREAMFTAMKTALFIQGILHRTQILPFPDFVPPILTDPSTWKGKLHLLYDDSMLLGEGKEPWETWIKNINRQTLPGQRVILGKIINDALYPEHAIVDNEDAKKPKIVKTRKRNRRKYVSLYSGNYIYNRPKRRSVHYYLDYNDTYINFDQAKVEDFEFYLRSREVRKSAKYIVPLLTQCIQAKKEEEEQEVHFKNLLQKEIAELFQTDPSQVEKETGNLIRWYKGKTKEWRPLRGSQEEERKALKMILSKAKKLGKPKELPIPPLDGTPLLIFQKDKSTLTSLSYEDPNFPALLTRQDWKIQSGKIYPATPHKEYSSLQTTDYVEPRVIYQNQNIILELLPEETFTPKNQLKTQIENCIQESQENPYAIIWVYESAQPPYIQTLEALHKDTKEWKTSHIYITNGKIERETYFLRYTTPKVLETLVQTGKCEEKGHPYFSKDEKPRELKGIHHLLYYNKEAYQKYKDDLTKEEIEKAKAKAENEWIRSQAERYKKEAQDEWRDKEYRAFLKEAGEPTLFEDHLQTILKPEIPIPNIDFLHHEGKKLLGEKIWETELNDIKNLILKEYKENPSQFFKKDNEEDHSGFFTKHAFDQEISNLEKEPIRKGFFLEKPN